VLSPHPPAHPPARSIVLPMLSFDDEDEELWSDDPQEFVRKG
jgi:hypothetical protein